MDRTRLLSAALVALVVVWGAGSVSELFLTTLSVGPDVAPAAATLLALVALVMVITQVEETLSAAAGSSGAAADD